MTTPLASKLAASVRNAKQKGEQVTEKSAERGVSVKAADRDESASKKDAFVSRRVWPD